MKSTILLLITSFVLSACSDESVDSAEINNKETSKPAKQVLSDQERMMQKAKDVEKKMQEADEKRRKALEDSGS